MSYAFRLDSLQRMEVIGATLRQVSLAPYPILIFHTIVGVDAGHIGDTMHNQ